MLHSLVNDIVVGTGKNKKPQSRMIFQLLNASGSPQLSPLKWQLFSMCLAKAKVLTDTVQVGTEGRNDGAVLISSLGAVISEISNMGTWGNYLGDDALLPVTLRRNNHFHRIMES